MKDYYALVPTKTKTLESSLQLKCNYRFGQNINKYRNTSKYRKHK